MSLILHQNKIIPATGEPSLCMSLVVLFALRHALESARQDAGLAIGDDFFHLGTPATPEEIFLTAKNPLEHYLLT